MFRPGNPMPSADHTATGAVGEEREEHGQPRPEEEYAPSRPTAAERARTLVEGNASAVLVIPGLDLAEQHLMMPVERVVEAEGDVLLLFPPDSPAVRAATHAEDDELTAVLEITDVAPVAVPHRIRGRAWVAGWLTKARDRTRPGWLRLEIGEGSVDDLWGAEHVEPDEFAAARPDPLAVHEAELLQHLASAHDDQLSWLCALVDDGTGRCPAADDAVPLALDRYGLRMRFAGRGGGFDARFEFPVPVAGIDDLRRSMHALFDAAHAARQDGPDA
ncbi:DUF2470 domain-containing protein [Streptantibioticus parmotrematis]|uniref:DUF2470 domain-containing protein n=1 Tax=Streptantibioticus parmotrematis TaxID=2873249 RepID=UPI00207BDC56|nr:DUF2470 domain-containing protein [Streptantibioticus parmotrematis]